MGTGVVGFPACITGHMTIGICLQGDLTLGVGIQGVASSGGGMYAGEDWAVPPEIHGILRDMVNKRAVCILLECFLVLA